MKGKLSLTAVALLLVLVISSVSLIPAFATSGTAPDISGASTVYLENLETGKVILRKESSDSIAPASSAKLITAMLALEHFKDAEDTTVKITKEMLSQSEGTSMKLAEGDELSAIDLIYATLCGGFNDAAYALAIACEGSAKNFVERMNAKASDLGARKTTYKNPTGFDSVGATTTLSDLIKISRAAANDERITSISSALSRKVKFTNSGEEFTVHNRNGLIGSHYFQGYTNPYASGLISGNTDLGGWCVITKFTIRGANYLCIVMGASEENGVVNSYKIANDLSEYLRLNFGFKTVMNKGDKICELDIAYARGKSSSEEKTTVTAVLGEDAKLFLPNTISEGSLTKKYYLYDDILSAPVYEDQRVGSVDFYYEGEIIATIPLLLDEDVESNDFLKKIDNIRSQILSRTTIISLFLFVSLTFLWMVFFEKKKKRRPAKRISYKR